MNRIRTESANCRKLQSQGTRRGLALFDLFVAFTLLVALMAVVTPLVVRHGRLVQSQRHYRLALEELTNQLDRLTTLPSGELRQALDRLELSDFVRERLPGGEITSRLDATEGGERITLQMTWNEPGRRDAPLTLAGWLFPPESAGNRNTAGGQR